MNKPAIATIGTLDTKGAEIAYVRERIEALGGEALVIDTGILGEPGCRADVSREEVAQAAGHDLESVRGAGSRGAAVELMQAGGRPGVAQLFPAGRLDGGLCLGGGEGAL